jgi:hypothetical protein
LLAAWRPKRISRISSRWPTAPVALQVAADAVIELSHRKRCDFAACNAAAKQMSLVVFDHGARANRTVFRQGPAKVRYGGQNLGWEAVSWIGVAGRA